MSFLKSRIYALLAMSALMGEYGHTGKQTADVKIMDREELSLFKQIRNISNGCKEFTFDDGFTCVALNNKNAQHKHDNWLVRKNKAEPL